MARTSYLWLIAAAACARGGSGAPDASPDSTDCAEQTYYRDTDGDGHGDPAAAVTACEPPAGTVPSRDDCDDTTAERHPGLQEICDGLDNDCNGATAEQCPGACLPQRRPPPDHEAHVYLVCNVTTPWAVARSTCASAGYKLVQIEDEAENAYVRNAATAAFGAVDIHLGGTDALVEGMWVWDGSDAFWQGGSGGAPVGGRYARWASGEPNDDGTEDCAEMKPNGTWNDVGCGETQRFICRK